MREWLFFLHVSAATVLLNAPNLSLLIIIARLKAFFHHPGAKKLRSACMQPARLPRVRERDGKICSWYRIAWVRRKKWAACTPGGGTFNMRAKSARPPTPWNKPLGDAQPRGPLSVYYCEQYAPLNPICMRGGARWCCVRIANWKCELL